MTHDHVWDKTEITEEIVEYEEFKATYKTENPSCECGEIRPTRRGNKRLPKRRARTAQSVGLRIQRSEVVVEVARQILRSRRDVVPWKGRRSNLINRFTDAELEDALRMLVTGGYIEVEDFLSGTRWVPRNIAITSHEALEDIVHPGRRSAIHNAINEVQAGLPKTKPGDELRNVLQSVPSDWEENTVRWAAALVQLEASGQEMMVRQFSAEKGLSKEFSKHRTRIERVLGPVSDFGLVDTSSLLFVAGEGTLSFEDVELRMTPGWGILGFERFRLRQLNRIQGNPAVFIENLTVFEAVAKGTVKDLENSLCFNL